MQSCDTNIFVYYLNSDCSEHLPAKRYLDKVFQDPGFALCELVLIELYVLLRTPAILGEPLTSKEAVRVVQQFRLNPNWRLIDYPGGFMGPIWKLASELRFPRRAIFDARLAFTLRSHGVTEFATRNTKDFEQFPFFRLLNPIDNDGG